MDRFEACSKGAQVVSFDVFDTLLERPFERAADLFEWVAPEAARLLGASSLDYRAERVAAEADARAALGEGEDPTRPAIADALAARIGCERTLADEMLAIELGFERRLLRARPEGTRMFRAAKERGLRLVATSDTTLDPRTLESLLRGAGFDGFSAILTSSAEGGTKRAGTLFQRTIAVAGCAPDRILHVGDHPILDGENARSAGLCSLVVPRRELPFLESPVHARLWGRHAERLDADTRCLTTVMGRMLGSRAPTDGSSFGGDPYLLGVLGLGPLLLGLALFVLESARRDRRERLFFLARDGRLILDAYERVATTVPDAPKASYLLTSRRAANVATMTAPFDVLSRVSSIRALGTARDVLEERLGLPWDEVPRELLARFELDATSRVPDSARPRLVGLVRDRMRAILDHADEERRGYRAYLAREGFRASPANAVVDVGYAGTLQVALDTLGEGPGGLGGYYLLTYRGAKRTLAARGLESRAYVAEYVERDDEQLPVTRHVSLYECLFLGAEDSVVRFRTVGDSVEAVRRPANEAEIARRRVVAEIQRGALDFVAAAVDAFGGDLGRLDLPASRATRALDDYFDDPCPRDAAILASLPFEDHYGSAGVRAIVDRGSGTSLWAEGRRALALGTRPSASIRHALSSVHWAEGPLDAFTPLLAKVVGPVVDTFAARVLSETKLEKLRREPRRFFADAKSPQARALGRLYLHHRRREDGERR